LPACERGSVASKPRREYHSVVRLQTRVVTVRVSEDQKSKAHLFREVVS